MLPACLSEVWNELNEQLNLVINEAKNRGIYEESPQ